MKNQPSAPEAPDPRETAGAQTATNVSTALANAQLNNVNQITPQGSLMYYRSGTEGNPATLPAYYTQGGQIFSSTPFLPSQSQPASAQAGPQPASAPAPAPAAASTTARRAMSTNDGWFDGIPGGAFGGDGEFTDVAASGGGGNGGGGGGGGEAPAPVTGETYPEDPATYQFTDPNSGDTYEVPQYTAVQTLSPEQQAIYNSTTAAEQNLANLARDQAQRLGDHMSSPLSFEGLPAGGSAANLDMGGRESLALNKSLTGINAPQGGIATGYQTGGPLQTSVQGTTLNKQAGGVQRGGPIETGYQGVGPLQRSVQGGQIDDGSGLNPQGLDRTKLNLQAGALGPGASRIPMGFQGGGDITRSYGTDFSQDRQRVENALMSRLNPSLERDREALRTRLSNQGIMEGSEAFDRAMNRFGEQSTDARMQAILAGGQEQSRLANLEAQRAGFQNAAQQQAYGQNMGRAGFTRDSQGQQFNQLAQRRQIGNAAIAQNNAARVQEDSMNNDAMRAEFQQGLAASDFRNRAAAQQFSQNMGQADFGNAAAMQQAGLNRDQAAFSNQAQAQGFGQDVSRMQMQNAAIAQNNAARSQEVAQNLGLAEFGNQASLQQTGVNQGLAGFQNAAQDQMFGQAAARQQANAQAVAQNNAARAQQAGFNNTVADNNFQQQLAMQSRMDQDRATGMGELMAQRNQPINEIGALLGTGQVTQPNFMNTNMPQIPTVDYAGLVNQGFQNELGLYDRQMSQYNSNMGGLLGLGGNIASGLILSDRRMKTGIRKVGRHGRLNVYEYRYKGGAATHRGFMADEVAQVAPQAVKRMPNGFDAIDYNLAMEAA